MLLCSFESSRQTMYNPQFLLGEVVNVLVDKGGE